MSQKSNIQIPEEINSYLWRRYLPDSTLNSYMALRFLDENTIKSQNLEQVYMEIDIPFIEESIIFKEEKTKILSKLGLKYPKNKLDDLNILIGFKLINKTNDNLFIENPIPKPEEVLILSDDELEILHDMKFEIENQDSFNKIIGFLMLNNNVISCSVNHIENITKVKVSTIRKVLAFLENEGSITIQTSKPLESIKKADKLYIKINKDVFNQKRIVI